MVLVFLAAAGTSTDQTAWRAANALYDQVQSGIVPADGAVAPELATPALTGCSDIRRASGAEQDGDGTYSRALTLCAAAPDVFVLVSDSGADDVSVLRYTADTIAVVVAAGVGLRD